MIGPQSTEWIETGVDDTRPAPAAPGPLASFARFVLCGGGVGVAASAAVPWAAELLPWPVANALITVVTTLLCTELHARVTFQTGRRAGWRRHLQSAGSAMAAYMVTTAAVLILDALRPSAGMLWQQAVYLGAAGTAGTGRFLLLRLVVFADSRNTAVARAQSPFPPETDPGGPTSPGIDTATTEAEATPPASPARRYGTSAGLPHGSGQPVAAKAKSLAWSTPGASSDVRCPVPG
ncbi:GtrA family protein [Streptomyces sp. NPDC002643]